jgi:hypothetical protein
MRVDAAMEVLAGTGAEGRDRGVGTERRERAGLFQRGAHAVG